jgi:putative membrane protein
MDGWDHMGTGAMVASGLVLLVVVLVVSGVVAWAVVRRPTSRGPRPPDARQMLGERFARGDIDDEEYRWRLGVLDGRP